jgi:large subunit ribosomal protein L17
MAGKRLGRTTSHRKAMRRNMAVALFEHEAIRTTEAKAKDFRRFVEKLITLAKKGTLHARRMVIAELGRDREMFDAEGEEQEQTVVQKLFDELAPRYADRSGGYTRLIRLAERRIGDGGRQVILQLVEELGDASEAGGKGASRRRRRAAKRHQAAAGAAPSAAPEAGPEAEEEEAPPAAEDEQAPEAEDAAAESDGPADSDEDAAADEGEEKED